MAAKETVLNLGPGVYDQLEFPHGVKSLVINGAGRVGDNATIIKGLKAAGLWYSDISNCAFQPDFATDFMVELDKTAAGHGTQANIFRNVLFNGRGRYDGAPSKVAFYMNRTSGGDGQGSENVFLNCHFSGAETCYVQNGYNALSNTFVGGNFQDYLNGIIAYAGSFSLHGTAFQSVRPTEQLDAGPDDGWDIRADSGGVQDQILVQGCRTESPKFYKGGASQPVTMIACSQPGLAGNLDPSKYTISGRNILRANGRPIKHNVVDIHNGILSNCYFEIGKVAQYHDNSSRTLEVDSSTEIPAEIQTVFASAANGPIELTLPDPQTVPSGRTIEVVRADNTANYIAVKSLYFNNTNKHVVYMQNNSLVFKALGGHVAPRRWYLLNQPARWFVN